MSWFSVDTLKAGLNSEALLGLTEKVKNAVPKLDPEMLQKLTLTTPELTAERLRIDQEEKRKERVRDSLAGMMPWETRDPERDILVEECKEAILQLSADKQNFYGPYHMPKVNVKLEDDNDDNDDGDNNKNRNNNEGDDGQDDVDQAAVLAEPEETRKGCTEEPTKEQLEKLKTLSPLPPRLEEFDLDAHVGLIQKLLKVDPMLVEMQSTLSGGGERERMFWRNYFFHCAWCRYEAGLSIDEIWSDQPEPPPETTTAAAAVSLANKTDTGADIHAPEDMNAEQEITFENHDDEATGKPEKAFASDPVTDPESPFPSSKEAEKKDAAATTATLAAVGASHADANAESADYEMVVGGSELDGAGLDDEPAVDYELDELEAEIARELED